ncbi:hypothetical protein wVul_0249 [Wolbachia endosymbiont of Armadillidium vulgare str. wVulC]|nr:hypothetical protein wVul_0249 [Wolbachia endosymbiont of Armadillidium vulgare str. wVulC]
MSAFFVPQLIFFRFMLLLILSLTFLNSVNSIATQAFEQFLLRIRHRIPHVNKEQKKCNAHTTEIKYMCAPMYTEEDTLHFLLSLII